MAKLPLIQVWHDQDLISESTWKVSHISYWEEYRWQSFDLTITNLGQHKSPTADKGLRLILVREGTSTPLEPASLGSNEAHDFLLRTLLAPIAQGQNHLIKLIVPRSTGYITRSDIIPLRLHDCPHVEVVRSFAQPLQAYKQSAVVLDKQEVSLSGIFKESVAGLLVFLDHNSDLQIISSELEHELGNRLSFPWIVQETPRERTLVLVEANSSHPQDGLGLYTAAKALGIKLVVLDEADHWLASHEGDDFREAFIPITLTNPPKPELTDHILTALKSYGKPIDGIMTTADTYWPFVAEAAIALGLPSASPEAFQIATNKYKTSVFAGHQAHHASNPEEAVLIAQRENLSYPLIAKPCGGWSSEAVYRVDSPDALKKAINSIFSSRHGHELVIEPYCNGPEVDVNLVLQDGQLLFLEVCDDLPKSADVNGPKVGSLSTFHELCSVYPSELPKSEIELLRDTFVDILLSLGLRSGVFHLEGRVENSAVEYKEQANGNMELTASDMRNGQVKGPKAWLIEINPRPLGMTGSQIIEHTYGIDYWGLALLLTVGDTTRSRALALPFKNGPQYTSAMVFIPADFPSSCQGVFDSDDICKELFSRRPDLEAFVSRCGCLVKRGQKVPHPSEGRNTFVAYFNVFSRTGRQEAMDIARQIREEVRYQFK
ncbi:multidrug resistance 3 [Fusarium longipes]|uniref:Multidrug resistance 3 n=1 Tax=Fusarium longipes TaxID=694270 RepID=A0A395T4G9_9HYPO|nr:multidrug resistance 3 [Fusarium longipes]